RTSERLYEAELHRLRGELLLRPVASSGASKAGALTARRRRGKSAKFAEAEACFGKAMAVARRQQAQSLELRAAVSRARMRSGQGQDAEVRPLLTDTLGWFTEGFGTPDLQDAKALLD